MHSVALASARPGGRAPVACAARKLLGICFPALETPPADVVEVRRPGRRVEAKAYQGLRTPWRSLLAVWPSYTPVVSTNSSR